MTFNLTNWTEIDIPHQAVPNVHPIFSILLKVTLWLLWNAYWYWKWQYWNVGQWLVVMHDACHQTGVAIFCLLALPFVSWQFGLSFSSTALNLYYNSGQCPHRPLPQKTWPSWKSSRSNLIFFSFNEQWLSLFLSIYGWWNVFSSMPQNLPQVVHLGKVSAH